MNVLLKKTVNIMLLVILSGLLTAEAAPSSKAYITSFMLINPVESAVDGVTTELIQAHLNTVYKGFNREMSLEDMREVANTVTLFYQAKGYPFTRAYLAPQEITNGVASLGIFPGNLTEVKIIGNEAYSSELLATPFNGLIGKPIKVTQLEQALNRVNNLPGLTVVGYFSKNASSDGTLINVNVKEETHTDFTIRFDNYGQESTGENRAFFQTSFYNPFGIADQIDLVLQKSLGEGDSTFGSLGYKAPLNAELSDTPLIGQVQLYRSEFFIGQDVLLNTGVPVSSSLELKGNLNGLGLGLNYTLRQDIDFKWGIKSSLDYRSVENTFELDGVNILSSSTDSDYEYSRFSVGADVLVMDLLPGFNATAMIDVFQGNTNDTTADDEDFTGVNLSGLGLLSLGNGDNKSWYQGSVEFKLNAQYSSDVLPSAERSAVVGSNGVSAFEPGLYFGDSSLYLGLEYLPSKLELRRNEFVVRPHIFYEYASGSKNRVSTDVVTIGSSRVKFSGAGIGIYLYYGRYLEGRIQWATPIRDEGLVSDILDDDAQLLAEISINFDL